MNESEIIKVMDAPKSTEQNFIQELSQAVQKDWSKLSPLDRGTVFTNVAVHENRNKGSNFAGANEDTLYVTNPFKSEEIIRINKDSVVRESKNDAAKEVITNRAQSDLNDNLRGLVSIIAEYPGENRSTTLTAWSEIANKYTAVRVFPKQMAEFANTELQRISKTDIFTAEQRKAAANLEAYVENGQLKFGLKN